MATLPTDWNIWRSQWSAWKSDHASDLKPCPKFAAGQNFMADEILGTWEINGRKVELSEVTFPDLTSRGDTKRYIGITYAKAGDGALVESFADLERELGI